MDRSEHVLASSVACAGSLIGAGLGAGSGDGGYLVVVLGFIGFTVFGLVTLRLLTGSVHPTRVMNYLLEKDDDS